MRLPSMLVLLLVGTALQSTKAFVPPAPPSSSRAAIPKQQQQQQQHVLRALDVASLDAFVETQPYLAAFLMCSLKASAADAVAQLRALANMHSPPATIQANNKSNQQNLQQQQEEQASLFSLDVPRNIGFVLYGGLWQGLFQTFLFTNIYPHLFGTEHTWTSVAPQVLFDTTFMGPCVFLPVCYSVKSLFSSESNCTNLLDCIPTGLAKYHHDVTQKGLLQLFWSIWIPAQVLNFSVVPTHWRVLFVAAVSFFWVCALSTVSSSPDIVENTDIPNGIQKASTTKATKMVVSRPAFAAGSFPQQRLNEL